MKPAPKRLSIVVPCFNEAASLPAFIERLQDTLLRLQTFDHELIFVDDGSTDATLALLREYAMRHAGVRVLELSRNFGKEAALTAGIDCASGDAVVPIDADLQHPPELLVQMVALWSAGNDVVLARRRERSGSLLERKATAAFYAIHNRVAECPIPSDVGDFRLLDRQVVEALKALPERRRFMKGLFAWVGFRQASVDFDVEPRAQGRSTFSRRALWSLALEGITSFSTAPLRIATWLGLTIAAMALVHGCWVIFRTLYFGVDVPGYASLLTAVLFLGGVQLLCLGVLGEYVGRTYSEAKQRPIYIVRRRYGHAQAPDEICRGAV